MEMGNVNIDEVWPLTEIDVRVIIIYGMMTKWVWLFALNRDIDPRPMRDTDTDKQGSKFN